MFVLLANTVALEVWMWERYGGFGGCVCGDGYGGGVKGHGDGDGDGGVGGAKSGGDGGE